MRERSSKGSRFTLSMFDAMLNLLGVIGTMRLTAGEFPKPPGSAHEYSVPWQAFETKDGYIVVATRQDVFWRKMRGVLGEPGRAEDARFASNPARVVDRPALVPRFEAIFRNRTVAKWLVASRAAQVPAAPVNNLDRAFAEPPVAERNMIVSYEHPEVGAVYLPCNPMKLSGRENRFRGRRRDWANIPTARRANCWVCRPSVSPACASMEQSDDRALLGGTGDRRRVRQSYAHDHRSRNRDVRRPVGRLLSATRQRGILEADGI